MTEIETEIIEAIETVKENGGSEYLETENGFNLRISDHAREFRGTGHFNGTPHLSLIVMSKRDACWIGTNDYGEPRPLQFRDPLLGTAVVIPGTRVKRLAKSLAAYINNQEID